MDNRDPRHGGVNPEAHCTQTLRVIIFMAQLTRKVKFMPLFDLLKMYPFHV